MTEDDGTFTASVVDGNHRLILQLEEDPDALVPFVVRRDLDCLFPGVPYDGALERLPVTTTPRRQQTTAPPAHRQR